MSSLVRRAVLLFTLGALTAAPSVAEAPTDLVDAALDRIETLYLDRGSLEASAVLDAVGRRLEEEIEWLMVSGGGGRLHLHVGGGAALGDVNVITWEDLRPGLTRVQQLITQAPADLDGDVRLDLLVTMGVTDALDRHSRVLYGDRLDAFDKRLKGVFYGVGARIVLNPQGELFVEEVFRGNPAESAGLRAGDTLVRIDGVSTTGMSVEDATKRITGPLGSSVELRVRRPLPPGGPAGATVELTLLIERDEVRIPNVTWKVLDGGFGYIRIDHFSQQTDYWLSEALTELDNMNALSRGIVLDLRDNTGGSMEQSAAAADAFLTAGDILRTVGPDGGKVRGLMETKWAVDDHNEPDAPIVILQNRRTASGAEILAGALRELERAVLIGDRSYGKGTVQKLYTLDDDTRLKLTVARYLLPGDLSIADVGIPADLPVGRVRLDADGVSLVLPVEESMGPSPLLLVDERPGWRTQGTMPADRGDVELQLALRILARAEGTSRYDVLQAAGEVRELVRAEEEQRLAQTLALHNVDWSAAPKSGSAPKVTVRVEADEGKAGEPFVLKAYVTNNGDTPLHRVAVRVSSTESIWDDLYLPVGRINPGQTSQGSITTRLPHSLSARESLVGLRVESDLRPPADAGGAVLKTKGAPLPALRLSLRLRQHPDGQRAEVVLKNQSDRELSGLKVYFEYPELAGVELTEAEAYLPSLSPGRQALVHLGLDLDPNNTVDLPLHIIVEDERYGELLRWSFDLPRDGRVVDLEAPRISPKNLPTSAPAGPFTLSWTVQDDRAVHHQLTWSDGDKLSYTPSNTKTAQGAVLVELRPGRNSFLIEAVDDQGLSTRSFVILRGQVEGDVPTSDANP